MFEERGLDQMLVVVVIDVWRTAAQMADGQFRALRGISVQCFGDQAVISGRSERIDEIDATRHGSPHQRRCCSLSALRPSRLIENRPRSNSVFSPARLCAIISPEIGPATLPNTCPAFSMRPSSPGMGPRIGNASGVCGRSPAQTRSMASFAI